jgi:hypothetical protein
MISGCIVKNLLLPGVDVMYGDAYDALEILSRAGVNVIFFHEKPHIDALTGTALTASDYPIRELPDILAGLADGDTSAFRGAADGGIVLRGRFVTKEGKTLYLLANKSRTDAVVPYSGTADAEIWDPSDGTVRSLAVGEALTVPAMRALFVIQ